jgi:hypothetical protein
MPADKYFVYKLRRARTGDIIYIGAAYWRNRPYDHVRRALHGKHDNKHLQRMMQEDNHAGYNPPVDAIVIHEGLTREQSLMLEQLYIELRGRRDLDAGKLLNLLDGGPGGGINKSLETTTKIGAASKIMWQKSHRDCGRCSASPRLAKPEVSMRQRNSASASPSPSPAGTFRRCARSSASSP